MDTKGVDTRERILNTALKLFVERGFAEVSINDLIKEVGIAKGGFYHHFKSKDELIYEIMEKVIFPHFNEIIRSIDEFNGSAKEKLLEIFKNHSEGESYLKTSFNVGKINDRSIMILIIECIKRYEIMATSVVEFGNQLIEKIEGIIEEGKSNGEFSSNIDSKSVALYIVSVLQGSAALWIMNPKIDMKMLFENNFNYVCKNFK